MASRNVKGAGEQLGIRQWGGQTLTRSLQHQGSIWFRNYKCSQGLQIFQIVILNPSVFKCWLSLEGKKKYGVRQTHQQSRHSCPPSVVPPLCSAFRGRRVQRGGGVGGEACTFPYFAKLKTQALDAFSSFAMALGAQGLRSEGRRPRPDSASLLLPPAPWAQQIGS